MNFWRAALAGAALAAHPDVDKITFTGSTDVGREIVKASAGNLKKLSLELGGKSPNIILDDANLDTAALAALFGTFMHQGQICESGTRVLVLAVGRVEVRARAVRGRGGDRGRL